MKEGIIAAVKPGCPACEQSKPGLRGAAKRKRVDVKQINVDRHPSLVKNLNIEAYPAIFYSKPSGSMVEMPWNGPPTATNLEAFAKKARKAPSASPAQGTPKDAKGAKGGCDRCGGSGTNHGNNVDPVLWGPSMWSVIHTVALSSPKKPTPAQRAANEAFTRSLAGVLPCQSCRAHFAKALKSLGPAVFASRDAFFAWTVDLHNEVSARVGKRGPARSVAHWKAHYAKKLKLKL